MLNMNRVTLVGNVGNDPEIRTTRSGDKVARFSLATTQRRQRGTDSFDETTWHRIVVFGGLAEVAESYLRKGDPVMLEGRISYRSYRDAQNLERWITEVIVVAPRGILNLLPKKPAAAAAQRAEEPPALPGGEEDGEGVWYDLQNLNAFTVH